MRTSAIHRAVAIAAVATAGVVFAAAAQAGRTTAKVGMTNSLEFTPHTVTVHVGDSVVWHNGSALSHTVTDVPKLASQAGDASLPAGAKSFNSGYIDPGKSYSHTFTVPGTYHYFCIPHEATGMTGVVIVKP